MVYQRGLLAVANEREPNSMVTEIRGLNLIFYVDATGVQTTGNKSCVMPLWVVGHVGNGSVQ